MMCFHSLLTVHFPPPRWNGIYRSPPSQCPSQVMNSLPIVLLVFWFCLSLYKRLCQPRGRFVFEPYSVDSPDSHLTYTLRPVVNKLICVNHCSKYGSSPPMSTLYTLVINDLSHLFDSFLLSSNEGTQYSTHLTCKLTWFTFSVLNKLVFRSVWHVTQLVSIQAFHTVDGV